ncbi:MAG: Holliday junction DNA helicase RuvA [Candidatus Liptonbacteria bacterium RIFCSPLOWO2_01_FULL_52_25]|uniref:Holliday junction branch migration complex subunit RuvA n=1 Tax=Candidatus Liptonbacteria bacterium RIFCSPLOWO2_01_FULL_52_25 TaxID=1798650 RepID=A0A1G2CF10_9BACT|nr:MAG: Holliday junction DNA helicase RuvA [Candidatus Liptonbacteria bacterium RIFCSPLOWO2_01_FULL_52_25]
MVYSIFGKLALKSDHFAVVEVAGLGLKVFASRRTIDAFPVLGTAVKMFCHLHVREDALDLFGFPTAEELAFFELLISVSGVGPKSALSIMDVAELKNLSAAIKEGRPDLLTKASGVGRKTAERIILDLKSRVSSDKSEMTVGKMDADVDLVETLVGLGYRRDQAKAALGKVDEKITNLEERLKAALKILGGK